MGVRTKTLITVILVGAVIGVFALQITNPEIFRGQIFQGPEATSTATQSSTESGLPDLQAKLEVLTPQTADEDLKANITIENIGKAAITSGQPFKYIIFLNDTEIFSNTDSYTSVEPGDAFSFTYPISKSIYQYPESGKITITVDPDNSVPESDENNNSVSVDYQI